MLKGWSVVFLLGCCSCLWAVAPQQQKQQTRSATTSATKPAVKQSGSYAASDADDYYLDFGSASTTNQASNQATSNQNGNDEYYLDASGKANATYQQSNRNPQVFRTPFKPIDRQSDQLAKITQSRDNPAPRKYWKDFLGASGLLDVDLADKTHPDFIHSRSDDISIPNIKFNIDAKTGKWLSAHMGFFWGDESKHYYPATAGQKTSGIQLDELYVTINNFNKTPVYMRVGKQYLPFGSYHRFPILTTLTQSLSELRESSIQIGFINKNSFYASAYGFRGLSKVGDAGDRSNYGAMLGYSNLSHEIGFDLGAGYLNNMIDVGAIHHGLVNHFFNRRVAGLSLHADLMTGPFNFGARYVSALRNFSANDFVWQTRPGIQRGAKPQATSLVAGYTFKTMKKESRIDLGFQWSQEAHNANSAARDPLQLPKNRLSASYAVQLWKYLIVCFEYDRDRDYTKAHGGTNRFNNTATIRLTVLL